MGHARNNTAPYHSAINKSRRQSDILRAEVKPKEAFALGLHNSGLPRSTEPTNWRARRVADNMEMQHYHCRRNGYIAHASLPK